MGNLGAAYADLGDVRRAIGYYEQAVAIAREIGDRRGEGIAIGNLGSAYKEINEVRRAIGYYEQGVVIAREIGDRRIEGAFLGNLGTAYTALGDVGRAIGYYEQHLTIACEIGDSSGEATASFNLAHGYRKQGNIAQALPLAQRALALYRQIASPNAKHAEQLVATLQQRVLVGESGSVAEEIRQHSVHLVAAVVSAARGNASAKSQVEQAFDQMTQSGFHIVGPIKRIWKGERDDAKLTAGLDETDTFIVRGILKQLK